ncbi:MULTISPECIES: hypothetical protein [unclassified Microbacterium]|uniref:hypothetical protein n=1 Tax=unclassified Microbacterium TaxID=2609290 RepID=UPI00115FEA4C|nr:MULTISPECIES: hypothetical protein [unclassified Microbacterium]
MKRAALVATIFAAALLTGCATTQGSTLTPDAAERDARDIFARTASVVSATSWRTEVTWGPCEIARDGHVQVMLVAQSLTDVPRPTPALAETVAEVWRPAGLQPTVTLDDRSGDSGTLVVSDPAYLTGSNSDGSLTQLALSDTAVLLQVVSPCIEGDLVRLRGLE